MTNVPSGVRLRMLHLVVTSACNLECEYCYQGQRRGAVMDDEVLGAALDLLLLTGDESPAVSFHGGEPLLELRIIRRAVEYLEGHRSPTMAPRYYVTTNGTLLDDQAASFLDRYRVRTVLSFDGIRVAQELRAPGTFDILDRTLTRLRDHHPRFFRDSLSVAITLTSSNLRYLNRSVRYLLGKGVESIEINPLLDHDPGWTTETRDELDRQLTQVDRASRDHLRRSGRVPVTVLRRYRRRSQVRAGPFSLCGALTGTKLAVDVDGQTSACVLLAESCQTLPTGLLSTIADAFRLGSIADPQLPQRLLHLPDRLCSSGLFRDQRDRHTSSGSCGDCQVVDQCSICPISIGHLADGDDPHRVPDHLCAFYSTALEHRKAFPEIINPLDLLGCLLGPVSRNANTTTTET